MKQQTGLQKLSKEFFYQLSISELHNKDSFEDYYQRVEEKWFNVQKFNDESSIPHTDTKIWEQLYFSVCQELVQLRKIYRELHE